MFSMCSVLRGSLDLRVSVHLKDKTSKTGGPTLLLHLYRQTAARGVSRTTPGNRVIRTRLTGLPKNIYLWICNFCFTAIKPEEAKWLWSKRGFEIILSASKGSCDIGYLILSLPSSKDAWKFHLMSKIPRILKEKGSSCYPEKLCTNSKHCRCANR